MHFTLQLMVHLVVHQRGALSGLHKDAQEGAFEITRKGSLEVALDLDLWLHLWIRPLMHKCVQNGSYTGGPDAGLEGSLGVGLNVGLEWIPQSSL